MFINDDFGKYFNLHLKYISTLNCENGGGGKWLITIGYRHLNIENTELNVFYLYFSTEENMKKAVDLILNYSQKNNSDNV